jgi:ATP-dependent Zn protease
MVAAIGMVNYVDAAYSDGSDVSSERPDDIFNSRDKSSYETKLGLTPEKNGLDPATDDIENYKLEESIIDIKKEKKKIISQTKAEELERSLLEKTQSEQVQNEIDTVNAKRVVRQEKEQGHKKAIIFQGIFVVLCLGTMWFIMQRPADS